MFDQLDTIRRDVSISLDQTQRSALGQFMTPSHIARFMASLFTSSSQRNVNVLDAGAGVGSLTAAFLERVKRSWGEFKTVAI